MKFSGRAAPALAVAALTVFPVLAGCGPAPHSPGCPPGQWRVDIPGTGWTCASDPDPGSVFTPGPAERRAG